LRYIIQENRIESIFCKSPELIGIMDMAKIPYKSHEDDFLAARAGLTTCEYLIARLGSIMISSKQAAGRRLVVYPDFHFVYATTDQLVPDLQEALTGIKERYGNTLPSMISVISGPSRTADIEKTLVMGAHGPKELYVFLVEK
jgi:L-lactate dehydrogenase complex protein LldG